MKNKKRADKTKTDRLSPPKQGLARYWHYFAIAFFVLVAAGIRVRLLDFPLERDEGEYAYAGQLILQGIPPYQLAYNMKLPGTYVAYSLILGVFGQTPAGIHMGLLLVNALTSLLVYLLAMRLFGATAGVVAGGTYALLSTSPTVLGLAAHATHFVLLPALAGLLLLLKAMEKENFALYFASGLCLGLAFLMKQPGLLFGLFAGLYLVRSQWASSIPWRKLIVTSGTFFVGAILPYAVTCLILYRFGVFQKFWFWTVSYASEYGTSVTISNGLDNFLAAVSGIVGPSLVIWGLAAVGLSGFLWNRELRAEAWFVGGFLVFSVLAVSAGFYFRKHYFILVLPAISILVGALVSRTSRRLSERRATRGFRAVPVLIFLAGFALALFAQREILFQMDPIAACRSVYSINPFPEAAEISDYIKNHSTPESRIAVLGSEPEIYFYSRRHSATGYIYTYGMMEGQKYASTMQKEAIQEIEAARPDFLVYVKVPTSWLARRDSDMTIISWAEKYIHDQYQLVGTISIGNPTEYHWEQTAQTINANSQFFVQVFKRNL